jgi:hypothetical protein
MENLTDRPARPDVDALRRDEEIVRQFFNDGADGNRARRALDRIMVALTGPVPSPDGAGDLYFEPSGDGTGACIHEANGAIICEAKYADFESDPSYPERVMKRLVKHCTGPLKDAPQVPQGAGERPRWKHKNRGTLYTEIGRGKLQTIDAVGLADGEPMVIYQGDDGQLWVRDTVEFEDGRFEFVPPRG